MEHLSTGCYSEMCSIDLDAVGVQESTIYDHICKCISNNSANEEESICAGKGKRLPLHWCRPFHPTEWNNFFTSLEQVFRCFQLKIATCKINLYSSAVIRKYLISFNYFLTSGISFMYFAKGVLQRWSD